MENKPNEYCIYGRKPILEALSGDKKLDKILVLKSLQRNTDLEHIFAAADANAVPVQFVPVEKLEFTLRKFTRDRNANHQGFVALCSLIENISVEALLQQLEQESVTPFLCIFDGVTDVGNLGAIARSAHCFGVQALVLPEKGSAPINPEAIKTSAGALHKLKICRVQSIPSAIKLLKAHGVKILAASEKAKSAISEMDFKEAIGIVMGDEGKGVSETVTKLCDSIYRIPMSGNFDSLNVSVSAGITFFEAMKQRSKQ